MKILLDHCVNRRVASFFGRHEVRTTLEFGWEALSNGELLRAANGHFDVLVTTDKKMEFQSSLAGLELAVAVLYTRANELVDLQQAIEALVPLIPTLPRGRFTRVPD